MLRISLVILMQYYYVYDVTLKCDITHTHKKGRAISLWPCLFTRLKILTSHKPKPNLSVISYNLLFIAIFKYIVAITGLINKISIYFKYKKHAFKRKYLMNACLNVLIAIVVLYESFV